MHRDAKLGLGDDAFRIKTDGEIEKAVPTFAPHVAFFGDVCVIGTSPVWTAKLQDAVKANQHGVLPWKPEVHPIEHFKLDGKLLAKHATALAEWMEVMPGEGADPMWKRSFTHLLKLLETAEYWTTTDGETRKTVFRLRFAAR